MFKDEKHTHMNYRAAKALHAAVRTLRTTVYEENEAAFGSQINAVRDLIEDADLQLYNLHNAAKRGEVEFISNEVA